MDLRYHAGRAARHVGAAAAEAALLVAITVALAMAVAVVGGSAPTGAHDALAAKGGTTASSSGCVASPSQVTTGDGFAVYGTGLPPSQTVYVYFDDTSSTASDYWSPTLVKVSTKADGSAFFMMRLLHWGDFRIKVLATNKYSTAKELAVCWVNVAA